MPEWITFSKLRAGSAQVGNDTGHLCGLNPYFSIGQDWGTSKVMYMWEEISRIICLKPERETSNEIGVDLKFLKNRIGLEADLLHRPKQEPDIKYIVTHRIGSIIQID